MTIWQRVKLRFRLYFLAFIEAPATLAHVIAHGLMGVIFNAEPHWSSLTLWPKIKIHSDGSYEVVFGSIGFTNINSFNALPVALAPLLLLFLPYLFVDYGMSNFMPPNSPHNLAGWALVSYLSITFITSSIPSRQDWRVAFSRPLGIVFYGGVLYLIVGNYLGII